LNHRGRFDRHDDFVMARTMLCHKNETAKYLKAFPSWDCATMQEVQGHNSVSRTSMGMIFPAITFAALFLSTSAVRADGTWCAQYSMQGGGTNCGFYSFEQCQATVSGIGGFCMRNPFAGNGVQRRGRR